MVFHEQQASAKRFGYDVPGDVAMVSIEYDGGVMYSHITIPALNLLETRTYEDGRTQRLITNLLTHEMEYLDEIDTRETQVVLN